MKPFKKAKTGDKTMSAVKTRPILKPKLAKLAKEYGGVTRLAAALDISQSTISKLIYTDAAISTKVAMAIASLTDGKLSFNALKKMHLPKSKPLTATGKMDIAFIEKTIKELRTTKDKDTAIVRIVPAVKRKANDKSRK